MRRPPRCINPLRARYRDDELAVARRVIIFVDVTALYNSGPRDLLRPRAVLPIRKVNTGEPGNSVGHERGFRDSGLIVRFQAFSREGFIDAYN